MARPQEFSTQDALQSSMAVFWDKGYEATSLTDLLSATHLSKSSLYATFGSKHALFLKAFDAYRQHRQASTIQYFTHKDARAGIEGFFRHVLDNAFAPSAVHGCMSINQAIEMAPHDTEIANRVREDFAALEAGLQRLVARGQDEGRITRQRSAKVLASLLVMGFSALQVMTRAELPAEQIDASLNTLLSTLD